VGRTEELAAVRALIEGAFLGRAGALLIRGDAGVGKTELVAQAIRDAAARATVVQAAALPLTSSTVPYLPLRAALARLAAQAGEEPDPVFHGATGGDGALLALDSWVTARCRDRPLVLVVDDVQWADPSTLDALMYLLSGPGERSLVLLLTLRQGEIKEGHRLHRWLADVRRLPGFQTMTLEPFDRLTTELHLTGLLGEPPHQSLVDDVHARTGGNAYLTRLLVTGLRPTARRLPDSLPTDLDGALLAAWHQLSGPARELTKVIATGGRRMHPGELGVFLGDDDRTFDDVAALLREAERMAVLDQASDGSFWFHHPLQAEVLARRVPVHESRSWYERFATHLEAHAEAAASDDMELLGSIADHRDRAGHPSQAYAWALRAAEAASAGGVFREELRWLRRALDLREHAVNPLTPLELLLALRDAAARAGDHESELEAVEALLAVTDDDHDELLRAELSVRRCQLRFVTGLEFWPVADLERAVELSSRQPQSWQHAMALGQLAIVGIWRDDPRSAEWAEKAMSIARASGDTRALCYAYKACGHVALVAGHHDEALEFATRALVAAVEVRDWYAFVSACFTEAGCASRLEESAAARFGRRRQELQVLGAPHPYVAHLASCEAFDWVSRPPRSCGRAAADLARRESRWSCRRVESDDGRAAVGAPGTRGRGLGPHAAGRRAV